ncbi:MAG: hypothetical protein GWP61_02265 [Chloroflexi bacterium]|jgi:hypothetical protein|nr:hypothetical protein [Chloroflexota bacterium]
MSWLLFLKLAVIVIFLIMFLKRPSVTWGIGLLTITSAVLLDALLGTFNEEELRAELGFFYYVIAGVLFGGAAIWLWGTLLPFISPIQGSPTSSSSKETTFQSNRVDQIDDLENTVTDGQMLYQEIRERFGREDILDLMFDLNINENDVMAVDQNLNTLINNIIEITRQNGQTSALALAVERILTPPPPDHLPRLERISADSPPTILRQYLMTHYRLHELEQMAIDLGIDWEQLDAGAKKEKVRSLLQYLYRRNRVGELVDLMHDIGRVEGTKA